MTNNAIYAAMIAVLNGAGLTYPIAYAGYNFDPPATGVWLEASFFPNRGIDYDANNSDDVTPQGIFQIAVNDRPGAGVTNINAAADAVMALYPKGTKLGGNVRVYRPAYASSMEPMGAMMTVIVTVPYSG